MNKSKKVRRLFLVAAYDAAGTVDSSLVYYVREMAKCGDTIVHMDNDNPDKSIQNLSRYTLHAAAARHGEYDFGSYKRAYMWAQSSGILNNYDFVYMVNDSVYGPLTDLCSALEKMEKMNRDAYGLVCNPNRDHPHIQSWFIGMRPTVFNTEWFDKFMLSVTKQSGKGLITKLYEQGFTNLIISHNLSWGCLYTVANRGVYNKIKYLFCHGMPFMKKVAFCRHGGALGRQILYVLNHISPDTRMAIMENANRTWSEKYISKLLTNNPFKIMCRSIQYAYSKAKTGKL